MKRHTPGPWKRGETYLSIISEAKTGHDDQDSLEAYGGHLVCESVKWDANAYLIAAAPDLYEALEEALSVFERMRISGGGIPSMKAALAKARGEA